MTKVNKISTSGTGLTYNIGISLNSHRPVHKFRTSFRPIGVISAGTRGTPRTPWKWKWGNCTASFKRYKRPSFELKLRRNTWAAGALPGPRWGSLQHFPRPPSSINGPTSKGGGNGGKEKGRVGKGRRSCTPAFGGESYALFLPHCLFV